MRRGGWTAWTAALVLAAGLGAGAQPAQVSASKAYIVEPASGATTASAYAVIDNPTMYDVYVVGVSTEAAGSAELADGAGGPARPVSDVTVPAYGQKELSPGGLHIRLKDLKKPLQAGDSVELTLSTDGGETVKVTAEVRKP